MAARSMLAALLCAGCSLLAPFDPSRLPAPDAGGDLDADADAGGDLDADADAGGDLDADADAGGDLDADAETVAGPLSYLVTAIRILPERVCDVDGDGDLDNALADLGERNASLAAFALNSIGIPGEYRIQPFVHISRVDDLARPSATATKVLLLQGAVPAGVGDARQGSFWVTSPDLDECGEPLFSLEGGIDAGRLEAEGAVIGIDLFDLSMDIHSPRVVGRIGPFGAEPDLRVCGVLRARDIGALELQDSFGGYSMLELMLAGGLVVGIPGLPGVRIDVDVDRDGLEAIAVDERGHVAECNDGDGTVIPGQGCWQDPRIADGISVTAAIDSVPSRLLGHHPAERWELEEACGAFPPAASRFGPSPGELCDRFETRPCEGACAPSREECAFDGSGFGPCLPASVEARAPSSCAELALEGTASCAGSPPSVLLVEAAGQTGGARLPEPVVVGSGPVVIEARVLAAPAGSFDPRGGWGLVAYLGGEGVWLGESSHLGFDFRQRGYAAQWLFDDGAGGPEDRVVLRRADGTGSPDDTLVDSDEGAGVRPALDPGVRGPVAQRLRLVISPDLPETEEDELAVLAQHAEDGGRWSRGVDCFGPGCPVRVAAGDPLRVGVQGGGYTAVRIELSGPLSVRAHGSCP